MKTCNKNCFECPYDDCVLDLIDDQIIGFPERLEKMLIERGLSQRQLARMAGITEPSLSSYCTGRRSPTSKQLIKMCKALKVSADWLLGLEG